MHRVLRSHVEDFKRIHSLEMKESKLFEAFGAFTLATVYSSDVVEPETLVYEGDDPGIDSALVFVNERYISTMEELESIFQSKKADNDVHIVFTQSKGGESWAKKDGNYHLDVAHTGHRHGETGRQQPRKSDLGGFERLH